MLREDEFRRKEKQKLNEKKRHEGKHDDFHNFIFQLHIRKIKYFIIQLMHRNSALRYLRKTTLAFLLNLWYNIIIKKMIDYDKQQLIITPSGISLMHTSCEEELWNAVEELTFEVVQSSERDHDMTFVNHHYSKENQLKSY